MMWLIHTLPLLLFTYVLSSLIVFMLLARFLKPNRDELPGLLVYTLAAGPMLIALFLWPLLHFMPGRADGFYIGAMLGIWLVLALMAGGQGIHFLRMLGHALAEKITHFAWKANIPACCLMAGVTIVLGLHLVSAVATPVHGSDQAQYAVVSSLGYERKTFDFYPLRDYDKDTGYFDNSDHPPAFYMLKLWHYMLQGTADYAGLSKLIEPVFFLYLTLMIGFVLLPYGLFASAVGMLGLLTVPGLQQAVAFHAIDPFRLAPFLTALLWLPVTLQKSGKRWLMAGGFWVGLAMYPHSIGGLLTFPLFALLYLALSKRPVLARCGDLIPVAAMAVLVGGWNYLLNQLYSGTPVAGSLPLLDRVASLDYYANRMFSMGIQTPLDMLKYGVLKQFTDPGFFGYAAWFAVISLILFWRRIKQHSLLLIALLSALAFIGLMAIASQFQQERYVIFVLNPRYPLTTQPFLILLAAAGIAWGVDRLAGIIAGRKPQWSLPNVRNTLVWIVTALLAVPLFMSGKAISKNMRHGHLSWRGDGVAWQRDVLQDGAYNFIRRNIPSQALFLAQSDSMVAYHLHRRVIGDIYPKLLPFYQAGSAQNAVMELRKLGVSHLLYHTGWWPSVVANSHAQTILANPGWVDLLYQSRKSAVYRLLPAERETDTVNLLTHSAFQLSNRQRWELPLQAPQDASRTRYRLSGWLKAPGKLDIFVSWQDANQHKADCWIWSSVSVKGNKRPFAAQFRLPPAAHNITVSFSATLNKTPLLLSDIQLAQLRVE